MGRTNQVEDDADLELAELTQRFREIYDKLRRALEASHLDEYVVINVRTGKHVVARWPDEAMALAKQTFGSSEYCWSKRIGTP